jgi:hypothetical protein
VVWEPRLAVELPPMLVTTDSVVQRASNLQTENWTQ